MKGVNSLGLFDSIKNKAGKVAKPEEAETISMQEVIRVDISKSAIRTDITGDEAGPYFKGCHLTEEEHKMRAYQWEKLLFEVTDRSKAFKELHPLAGKRLDRIVIRKKQGEYRLYYFVSVKA